MQRFTRRHVAALVMLTLFSSLTFATMGNTAEAAGEPVQVGDVPSEEVSTDAEYLDTAALAWLADQMQMSIDPTTEPQGIKPDYSCTREPYNCPFQVRCDFLPGVLCTVTHCEMGECRACPVKTPGLIIKHWCSYACMKESTVVAGAFLLRTKWNTWFGPVCL